MQGLSFAPFESEQGPPPQMVAFPSSPIKTDRTECNYLVMFFVAGVDFFINEDRKK